MAAFIGPDVSEHAQVCASDLLATLLTHGPSSRLAERLTQTSDLAFEVGVDFLTQRDRSLFGVWAVCRPERIGDVKQAIVWEMQRLAREPVPAAEFATAKRLLAAGYAFANETTSDRATTLAFYEAIDTYRIASYYLSWVNYAKSDVLTEVAHWYSGEPVWIILRPRESK
jgi:predicted Zn-dependent peptidase